MTQGDRDSHLSGPAPEGQDRQFRAVQMPLSDYG